MDIILSLLHIQKGDVNPWTLMLIGMGTVFAGLILLNFIINMLKLITNPKGIEELDKHEIEVEEINKALFENVDLSDDEILATSLAVSIEYDLYYSDENFVLTINNTEKQPSWINNKRR